MAECWPYSSAYVGVQRLLVDLEVALENPKAFGQTQVPSRDALVAAKHERERKREGAGRCRAQGSKRGAGPGAEMQ